MKLKFCAICGTTEELQHHHLIPKSKGGTDDETNILTLCHPHHCWFHDVKPSKFNKQSELIKAGLARAKKEGRFPGRKTDMNLVRTICQIKNLPFQKPLGSTRCSDILYELGYTATRQKTREQGKIDRWVIQRLWNVYKDTNPKPIVKDEELMKLVKTFHPTWFTKYLTIAQS